MDIQANGGLGFSFNDLELMEKKFGITNPIWQIEKAHITKGVQKIIPTFITDSNENIEKLMEFVVRRISNKSLPKLLGIHFEGNFATNVGTHNEVYNRLATKENIEAFILSIEKSFVKNKLMKRCGDFPISIQMTIAPDLFFQKEKLNKNAIDSIFKLQKRGVKFFVGHTKVTCKQFKIIQKYMCRKGEGFFGISHLNNAMLGGHFIKDTKNNYQGLIKYLIKNNDEKLKASIIFDGIHVKPKLDLIPTFLLFANKKKLKKAVENGVGQKLISEISDSISDKIIIISDCGPVVGMDKKIQKGFLADIGGNVANVHINKGEAPSLSWYNYTQATDLQIRLLVKELERKFKKNIDEILEDKKSVAKFLMDLQIKDKGRNFCYDTLSASVLTLKDCIDYFKSQKWIKIWIKEIKKKNSKSWEICKDILMVKFKINEKFLEKNESKIKKILEKILKELTAEKYIEKMTKQNAIDIFGFDKNDFEDLKISEEDLKTFKKECNNIAKKVKKERRELLEKKLYGNIYKQLFEGIGGKVGLIKRIELLK